MITRERLRELFTYDDLTGRLVRKICNDGEKPITNGVSKQGYYDTPEDAARAYNRAALNHFGKFAYLNDV